MKTPHKINNSIAYGFKVFLLLIASFWVGRELNAQTTDYVPAGIPFQGLVRDNINAPAKNREVAVLTTITDMNGVVILKELFNKVLTNRDGVFSVILGQGISMEGSTGSLASINWQSGPHYLQVEVAVPPTVLMPPSWDYTKEFKDMGKTQIWSVPYALNAGKISDAYIKNLTNERGIKVKDGIGAVLQSTALAIDSVTLAQIIVNTPAIRDSLSSVTSTIIQSGKIAGQSLTNSNGILVTGGDSAVLRATSLRLDSSAVARQVVSSPVKDSIAKVLGYSPVKDSLSSVTSTIIQSGKIAGQSLTNSNGILVTGGDSAVLRATSLRLDSSAVARQVVSSPVKDSIAKVLGYSPVKDSLSSVTSTIIQSGKIAGQALTNSNGILVTGGDSAVLRATSLRLDSSAVARQVVSSPVKDSIAKVLGYSPVKDSLSSVTSTIIQSGKIAGQALTNSNGILVTGGDSAVLRATSLRLDSSAVARQVVSSPVKDSIAKVLGYSPVKDSLSSVTSTIIQSGKIAGQALTNSNGIIVTGGDSAVLRATSLRLDSSAVARQVVSSPVKDSIAKVLGYSPVKDSLSSVTSTIIQGGKIAGQALTNSNGILVTGGDSAVLRATSLRLDSSAVARQVVSSPVKDSIAKVLGYSPVKDSLSSVTSTIIQSGKIAGQSLTNSNGILVTGGDSAVLRATSLRLDSSAVARQVVSSPVKDSIAKVLGYSPVKDSLSSVTSTIIQSGKIAGQALTNSNGILVTGGDSAVLRATSLRLDSSAVARQVVSSPVKDSIAKVLGYSPVKDSLSSVTSTIIQSGKIAGQALTNSNGILVTGGDSAVLRATSLRLDSSAVADMVVSSPVKDSIAKVLGYSPVKDSLSSVTSTIIQSGKIAGQALTNSNGILVTGGDSAVLRATSLRLDSSVIADMVMKSPVKDSLAKISTNNGWSLKGNAGTVAGTNFIGTTDSVELVVKTNNTEKMRVLANGNVGINTVTPGNVFEVNSGMNDSSGFRLTRLRTSSGALPAYRAGGRFLSVNEIGDIILVNSVNNFINVYGLDTSFASPIKGHDTLIFQSGTFEFPGYKNSLDYIYVNVDDGTQWVYDPTIPGYRRYTPPGVSSWYEAGTVIDVGGRKTVPAFRSGEVITGSSSESGDLPATYSIDPEQTAQLTVGGEAVINNVTVGLGSGAISTNTTVGYRGLYNNIAGDLNLGLGYMNLYNNTNGSNNTATGVRTLFSNTTGNNNTALGSRALGMNTTGSYNTALGNGSGLIITTGSNNIMLGNNANPTIDTASNQLNIGNTIYGTNVNNGSNAHIGINTNTPGNVLEINSGIRDSSGIRFTRLRTSSGAFPAYIAGGRFLSVNETGDVILVNSVNSFINVYGLNQSFGSPIKNADTTTFQAGTFESPYYKNSTDYIYVNVYDGTQWVYDPAIPGYRIYTPPGVSAWYEAGTVTDIGGRKTQPMFRSGPVITGSSKESIDTAAVYSSSNATAQLTIGGEAVIDQIIVGRGSGRVTNNTTVGYRGLYNNTTGQGNSAFGHKTLMSNTTGSFNVAIGDSSLVSNTTGSFNTAIGDSTLVSNTTGNYNTALGYHAGSTALGNNNILIGANSVTTDPTAHHQLNIGNNIYGTNVNNSGNARIGINTNAPSQALEVNGQLKIDSLLTGSTADSLVVVEAGTSVLKKIGVGALNKNDSTTASNGLSLVGKDVQLGGTFTKANVLTTTTTNTLAIRGLQLGSTADSIVVAEAGTSVLKKIGVGALNKNDSTTASNGLSLVGKDVQLGGVLSKADTITTTTTNTLAIRGLQLGSIADSIVVAEAGTSVLKKIGVGALNKNDSTTASNGLSLVGKDVQLGGALSKADTITTSATNTLAIRGLQLGSIADSIVVAEAGTSVLKKIGVGALNKNDSTTASNGLSLVGKDVQLGGALSKADTITTSATNTLAIRGLQTGSSNDSLLVIDGNSGVLKRMQVATLDNLFWTTKGNAGTLSGTNFVGTTDFQNLVFKRGNQLAGLLDSSFGNTVFGVRSFSGNTSGMDNTVVGFESLATSTGASYNTALGYQTLKLSTADRNTAIGHQSLLNNSTGTENSAVGYQSLKLNTSGSYNLGVGDGALLLNTTGSYNTGVGFGSISGNGVSITGNHNIGLGNKAGINLSTGNYNIAIGDSVLLTSPAGNNQLNIGNNIYGTNVNNGGYANVGINTNTPANTVEIKQGTAGNSGLRFTNLPNSSTPLGSSSVNGKFLSVNANGDVVLANVTDPVINVTGGSVSYTSPITGSNYTTFQGYTFENSHSKTDSTVIYVYQYDGTTWIYTAAGGGQYKSYVAPSGTEWYTMATTTDAGSNKAVNIYRKGSVGIGNKQSGAGSASFPTSTLEVDGASTNYKAFSAASTTIDFTMSNLAYTSASAGSFTLNGMKDGGTYTLAVQGATAGTSSFSGSNPSGAAFTFKSTTNSVTTASKHTLYTFIVMGTTVYYYMVSGF